MIHILISINSYKTSTLHSEFYSLDWIKMNPIYNQGIVPTGSHTELGVFTKPLTSSFMSKELHDETLGMYLKAARQNHLSKISCYLKLNS